MGPEAGGPRDEELMRDFLLHRDPRHFEELFRRYAARAVALARALLRDQGAAEDAAQEAFIRLTTTRSYEYPRPFSGWFLSIVRNLALDRARRQGRDRAIQQQAMAEAAFPVSAEKGVEEVEERHWIRKILDQAPADIREPILLRLEMGLSFEEIAKILGTTNEAVRKRFSRAIQAFGDAVRQARSGQGGKLS